MNNNGNNGQKFSDGQRKALVQELKDNYNSLRYRAEQKHRHAREQLTQSLIREAAEKTGFLSLIDEIASSRSMIEENEAALAKLGVAVDEDGDLGFESGTNTSLRRAIQKKVDEALGTEDDFSTKFDTAAVKIWTVSSPEAAEKIIAELL